MHGVEVRPGRTPLCPVPVLAEARKECCKDGCPWMGRFSPGPFSESRSEDYDPHGVVLGSHLRASSVLPVLGQQAEAELTLAASPL